jgi:hypothetical protein
MDAHARRARGSSRLVGLHADDGSFDRAFWSAVPPQERLAAVWELVLEDLAWRSPDATEPRLQRSVCRLERRGG